MTVRPWRTSSSSCSARSTIPATGSGAISGRAGAWSSTAARTARTTSSSAATRRCRSGSRTPTSASSTRLPSAATRSCSATARREAVGPLAVARAAEPDNAARAAQRAQVARAVGPLATAEAQREFLPEHPPAGRAARDDQGARRVPGRAGLVAWGGYRAAGKLIAGGARLGAGLGDGLASATSTRMSSRGARRGYLAPGDPTPPPTAPTDYFDYRGVADWPEAANLEGCEFGARRVHGPAARQAARADRAAAGRLEPPRGGDRAGRLGQDARRPAAVDVRGADLRLVRGRARRQGRSARGLPRLPAAARADPRRAAAQVGLHDPAAVDLVELARGAHRRRARRCRDHRGHRAPAGEVQCRSVLLPARLPDAARAVEVRRARPRRRSPPRGT